MRLGILTDIHANVPALEAVLEDLRAQQFDQLVSLGDVVGYGPDPHGCLNILADLPIEHLQGNHEARLLDLPTGRFNTMAETAIEFNRAQLSDDEMKFIADFPPQRSIGKDVLAVHGSPYDRDEYILGLDQMHAAIESLAESDHWICVCGHTHQQYVFDGERAKAGPLTVELSREKRYLINAGSVGQPRDGDPRAAYALIDLESGQLDLRRVEYDVERAAGFILDAGLPEYLARRLRVGK